MPRLRLDNPVVLIGVGDVHASLKPPIARSAEDDWLEAQRRCCEQLTNLSLSVNGLSTPPVPLVYVGDVFDRWNAPAEIINHLLVHLPGGHAIWGNHDLPHHDPASLRRSAFWTLVKAGKLALVAPGAPVEIGNVRLHGFPYGHEVEPLAEPHSLLTEVAVVHAYIWSKKYGTGFPGAPPERAVKAYVPRLTGYDVALFGDNHVPLDWDVKDGVRIRNVGCLLRRTTKERAHKPSVVLLRADGALERHYLDAAADKFLEPKDLPDGADGIGLNTFLEEMGTLGDAAISFTDAVRRMLEREKVSGSVKKLILAAMESAGQHR